MIFRLFLTLLLGIFGLSFEDDGPARLDKVETKTNSIFTVIIEKMEGWVLRHSYFCLGLIIFLFALVFTAVCYALIGVSAVESGGLRNFLNGGMV